MKKVFLAAGIVFAFIACNDNSSTTEETNTTTDSLNHNEQHTDSATANSSMDTSSMSGMSMMSIMQRNMDQMKAMASTSNPDNDFAAMMKMHHMGAIEMAQVEVGQGTNAEMKAMAHKMVDDQQKEVAEFNSFLSGHKAHGGGDAFHKEVMSKMNNMNMDMSHTGSVDQQFAQMMIPHHQGAIDMSKAYLKTGAHEEKLKTMANKIIADQQKEIGELQAWLDKNKTAS